MSHHVPFHEEVWTVPDSIIPGNSQAEVPCRFHISMGSDDDLAMLKSIVVGAVGITPDIKWTPQIQRTVAHAFKHGRDAFIRTVDEVDGLTVQAKLARKAGLMPPFVPGATDISGYPEDAPYPIKNGYQFSRVAPYMIIIGFVLATEIVKLTDKGNVDARFIGPLFGSSTAAQAAKQEAANSTVPSVPKESRKRATAGGQKKQPASRRAGTSNRKR